MKRVQPTLRKAFAGQTLTLALQRRTPAKASPSQNPKSKGRLNYLGGPQSTARKPQARPPSSRYSTSTISSQGRFIGDSEKLIAFVMLLDEDTLQAYPAANQPVF